ncbi:MAG TPA: hypothetical protein VKB51_04830 [bacterium]|nr:hypothetical protein [bacterium]
MWRHWRWAWRLILLLAFAAAQGGVARAQTFFPEREATWPGSLLSVTISDFSSSTDSTTTAGTDNTKIEDDLWQTKAALQRGWFGLGGVTEQRSFTERSGSLTVSNDRELGGGYLSGNLTGLLTETDQLWLVLSAAKRTDTYRFDTFTQDVADRMPLQVGLAYRVGVLLLGYGRGTGQLSVTGRDPGTLNLAQDLDVPQSTALVGLLLGDPGAYGLDLTLQRRSLKATVGTQISLDEAWEEELRTLLGLGRFSLEYTLVRSRRVLLPLSDKSSRERRVSLGLRLTPSFSLAASQRWGRDTLSFPLQGTPATDAFERTDTTFTFLFTF